MAAEASIFEIINVLLHDESYTNFHDVSTIYVLH